MNRNFIVHYKNSTEKSSEREYDVLLDTKKVGEIKYQRDIGYQLRSSEGKWCACPQDILKGDQQGAFTLTPIGTTIFTLLLDANSPHTDNLELKNLPTNGASGSAGGVYVKFRSPDNMHEIIVQYKGEPPHGDPYYELSVDGIYVPGYAWGNRFAWAPSSRYFVCSWMHVKWERKTIVIDVVNKSYYVLPEYFYDFKVDFPTIHEVYTPGVKESHQRRSYTFQNSEIWLPLENTNI